MVSQIATVSLILAATMVSAMAQRSPYASASDPGVLPQYLPEDDVNRFGNSDIGTTPSPIHEGTLETEALYNRVQTWPESKKPFWYLNAEAVNSQRQQQQQQLQQVQNPQSPFAAGSRRTSSVRRQNS